MRSRSCLYRLLAITVFAALSLAGSSLWGQSTSTIYGTVKDSGGAVIASAKVIATNQGTGIAYTGQTDGTGNYQITGLPPGTYRIEASAPSMQKKIVTGMQVEISRNIQQNFALAVAATSQEVTVSAETPIIESSTMTVGQVISQKTVQEVPLNGRHFVDLGLLVPGSVTPPQSGFLTAPLRGQGSFAFNTAGQREDTVNFMINGINLNDMVQNQITFQPSINTVSEFKVDNQTYSAEFGRNSGAIVNIATRSGTNKFHGEVFEFLRNEAMDARNYFQTSGRKAPFKRNNFGISLGGPIVKNRTFFFFSYEGTRQRQGLTINQTVLTSAERAGVTDPTSQKLVAMIPQANVGSNIYQSAATAPVDIDQETGDIYHRIGNNDNLHGYYAFQRDKRIEPTLQGNNITGFGDNRASHRQIGTINETHTFSPTVVNEARLGFNRIHITFAPNFDQSPGSAIGVATGAAAGIPQFTINSIGVNFGGPAGFPQGRGDTTVVLSDTVSWLKGNHSLHIGGEFRRFNNNNFSGDTGRATFLNVAAFQAGDINSYSITPGNHPSRIYTSSLAGFIQDNWKVKPNVTLELGLRYEWNGTPVEAQGRFVNFIPSSDSLVQTDKPYPQSAKNFQPRLGFAWDVFNNQKTVLRGGYSLASDQPVTNAVTGLASNPPFAAPVSFAGSTGTPFIPLSTVGNLTPALGTLSPSAIDPNFHTAYVQSYNINIQHQLTPTMALMIGYFGNRGTDLRISENINQFVNGVRPYPTVSASSPYAAGRPLGFIGQIDSAGRSRYNALWVTANKHMGHGLQFDASYTYSKSMDYNSLSSQGVVIQNSLNPKGDWGPSDFDARNRFVISAIYDLPFKGNRLKDGWRMTTITQVQSGNPIPNISVSGLTQLTGLQTIRPDVNGSIGTTGNPTQWFTNPKMCDPRTTNCSSATFILPVTGTPSSYTYHFGDMARGAVYGPGFVNSDVSLTKTTKITEQVSNEFRFEVFDLFNHPNFGNPGTLVGTSSFGVIRSTRFPTGDSGSSRQLQVAMKFIF